MQWRSLWQRVGTLALLICLCVGLVAGAAQADDSDVKLYNSSDIEIDGKIDINNTTLRKYRKYPGMYPTLARILVLNAPYKTAEDILKIPGLTPAQIARLEENLPYFVAGPYQEGANPLYDRINKGYYD
ncbi:MAG: Photosystem II extrinsic protein [Synechococcaceae cyanobacterium SM2_3_60]|nr:Photosystem II extrinsic protein [Synechococcaceae cyanobacterium SM2_3_60]